jgi:hypothetical protein
MAERKFFETPKFQDAEWHKERGPAKHIDDVTHGLRLELARGYARYLCGFYPINNVVDLGCGDGGLISLLAKDLPHITFTGYDLAPKNIEYGKENRVKNLSNATINYQNFREVKVEADLVIMTEVLEHLVDPHEFIETINAEWIIASSPLNEEHGFDPSSIHLWGWDYEGYKQMFINSKRWTLWLAGLYQQGDAPLEMIKGSGTIFITARRKQ